MPLLALKLILTPLIVGGVTVTARRVGPGVGGLLLALPLTSGPVAFFLALDQGPAFSAATIEGSLGGLAAIAAYGLAYARVARRGPLTSILAASLVYVACGGLMGLVVGGPALVPFVFTLAAVSGVLVLVPAPAAGRARRRPPAWDLPARIGVATALIVCLTEVAPTLGPGLSGLVATFPVYVSILAVFTHHVDGPDSAVEAIRGLLVGLYGTATFMLVVHLAVVPLGIAAAFLGGLALTLVIELAALRIVRRAGQSPDEALAPEGI